MSQEINIQSDESADLLLADVIIPVPIPKFFTYKVPDFAKSLLKPGHRVIVQFGKKILTGLIWRIHHEMPSQYEPRFILDIIDK